MHWDRAHLWRYRARVASVTDGDTFTALIDTGFRVRVEMPIRIADLWAPELRQTGGDEAKRMLEFALGYNPLVDAFLPISGWPLRIVSRQRDTIVAEVRSFERYVADVYRVRGEDLIDVRSLLHETSTFP